ncbi:MAG: glycosyltransferase [bacterium]|nr:glycosyltransferase [bacterium]
MITVIIPTLGLSNILKRILFFLNFQVFKDFEVIVVDNSERSGNLSIDTKYNLKIVNTGSFGGNFYRTKSFARNLGLILSKTDYVLFIDADMIPHPMLISEHWEILKRYENSAVVGLELRTIKQNEYEDVLRDIQNINSYSELESLFCRTFSNRSRRGLTNREIEWYKFLTGNLSGNKEFFIKVGMFNTDFVSYGFEDLELGYRFDKFGINITFNPKALTIHLHPLSVEKRIENKKESVKNLKKFYQTYGNKKILQILGINIYSRLIYDYLPLPFKNLLQEINDDYRTNYNFWREWNTKN